MANLQLSLAITNNPRTWPIIDGRAKADGIDFTTTVLGPAEMFWRQLQLRRVRRFRNVDVVADDDPRRGRRAVLSACRCSRRGASSTPACLVRKDAGIDSPADLKGKRVGVPEYMQTAALWIRGVLENEFGVAPKDMISSWSALPARSHAGAIGFKAPPGVTINQIPPEKSIGSMMLSGELDACMSISRNHEPRRSQLRRISTIIPTSSRCSPIPPPRASAITKRPASTRSITAWSSSATVFEQNPWVVINILKAFKRGERHRRARAARACRLPSRNRTGAAGLSQWLWRRRSSGTALRPIARRSKRRRNIPTSRV